MVQDQLQDRVMKLQAEVPVILHVFHQVNIHVQGMFQVVQVVRVLIITIQERDHLHPVQDMVQVPALVHLQDLLLQPDHITVVP